MPVNVAFGPSAGISGALAFGTGKRKYSDQKAQIEQQSKRQMLSDAMNFAKFLQDTRRPEEDQRRALARMDKQQEIAQKNATFNLGIKKKADQWDLDFKNRARKEQIDALDAAIEKINEEAKAKEAADVPKQDIAKWRNERVGYARASILGTSPPQPRNPYDGAVHMGGSAWFTDPNTGKWVNASKDKAAADLKQKEIDNDTLRIVHDAVNKGSVAISTAYKDEFGLLTAGYEALETRRAAGVVKYDEEWLGSAEHTQYENDKRALDAKFEALQIRKRKDLRRMETGILAPYAAQGDEGRRSGAASVFAGRLGQLQREEELERAEREEDAFLDLAKKGDSTELGREIISRTSTPRSEDDPLAPFGPVTSSKRGLELLWGGAEWPEANPKDFQLAAAAGPARMDLPHSDGSIDSNLYHQIGLDESGTLARAAIRKGLLTPGDAGTILAEAKSGRKIKATIHIGDKQVAFTGTPDQIAKAEQIAADADRWAANAVDLKNTIDPRTPDPLQGDREVMARLADQISETLTERFNLSKSRGGADPAGADSDAELTRYLKFLKGEFKRREAYANLGQRYPDAATLTPDPDPMELARQARINAPEYWGPGGASYRGENRSATVLTNTSGATVADAQRIRQATGRAVVNE